MQRLIALLRRVRERPPPGSAPAPGAAGASELREKGWGELHSAAASGDLARLRRRWWWKRLRINWRDAKKQTPLHLACANGHTDVVRFLVGKKCHLNPRDSFKKSPLMKAVEHQHKDCATLLLEHGANPDLRAAGGNTALHLAAIIRSKSLAELLLEHNAHIDAQNELGYTPLTVAVTEHCEEMVEFLLQKGADVHTRDNHERTTLMFAAFAGDMNIIRLLLRHGADISHEDRFGRTAMHYASTSARSDIAKQLEEYVGCERMGQSSAAGTEGPTVLDSSCSGTPADFPWGTPTLTGAGVLPAARAKQEDDDNSPLASETDSEGPRRVATGAQLPAADSRGACTPSVAEGHGNGVLPAAEQEEDDDSPLASETDSEGPRRVATGAQLPAADSRGACMPSVAEGHGNGVLPAARAKQEDDDDSPLASETDSEGPRRVATGAQLPAADSRGACTPSVAEGHGNGVLPAAEQAEDDGSSFKNELLSLLERLVRQLQQELADALKKNSLAEASLEAKKRYSRDLQEQKLQLQKELDRSKAKLQELKERRIRTECYVMSLKNAIKNKERELTTSRNLQDLLVAYSRTTAIAELKERIQRLQVENARLEATVQQQAKTTEALQKDLQASASAQNGLEDLVTGFQKTRTANEHQHRQRGSKSEEEKKLAEMKCRSEARLDKMRGRNVTQEEERTRLKMHLEGTRTKLICGHRESQLSFQGEMKNSCSEVANQRATNAVSMAPHLTDLHRMRAEPPTPLATRRCWSRGNASARKQSAHREMNEACKPLPSTSSSG